jgi:hypothetical protein
MWETGTDSFEEVDVRGERDSGIGRPSWFESGRCRGMPADLFLEPECVDEATAVCQGCPVRGCCLEYAFARPDVVGVWGGTTAATRRALRAGHVVPAAVAS